MNSYRSFRSQLVEEPPRYDSTGFFATQRTNQTIVAGNWNFVLFDTGLINDNGCFNFNPGAMFFQMPKAGRMQLNCSVPVLTTTASGADCFIRVLLTGSQLRAQYLMLDGVYVHGNTTLGSYHFLKGSVSLDVEIG